MGPDLPDPTLRPDRDHKQAPPAAVSEGRGLPGLPNPMGGEVQETVSAPTPRAPMTLQPKKRESIDEIERILEEIIRERWKEVEAELDKVKSWKNKLESKVDKLSESVNELKTRLDMIHVQTTEKVEEYGKAMTDAKIEMQALEKAMSKLIPSLSDNIRELREVVEASKKKLKKKSEE